MAFKSYYTIDRQIIGERNAGGRTNYCTDALGSVTATVDSSGNVVNTYRYKPYGATLAKTGTGADPKNQWVGSYGYRTTGRTQSESYIRARQYGQRTAIWTSVDPIWPEEIAYIYARSSPLAFIDLSGRDAVPAPIPPKKAPPLRVVPGGVPKVPKPIGAGPFIIIAAGAEALIDLGIWACTGETGFFTGIGEWLGKQLFPGKDYDPDEAPDCEKFTKLMTLEQAEIRRQSLLKLQYKRCKRQRVGPWERADCPGTNLGGHQTDIYLCKSKESGNDVRISASVICCICQDNKGGHWYCYASVHPAHSK